MDATMDETTAVFDGQHLEIQNVTSSKVLNQAGHDERFSHPVDSGNQRQFEIQSQPISYGYYEIKSVKSSRDVVVQSASTANGANLVQCRLFCGQ